MGNLFNLSIDEDYNKSSEQIVTLMIIMLSMKVKEIKIRLF